jgi:hypothetical protein
MRKMKILRSFKESVLKASFLAYETLCIHTWSNTKKSARYGRDPENITIN